MLGYALQFDIVISVFLQSTMPFPFDGCSVTLVHTHEKDAYISKISNKADG